VPPLGEEYPISCQLDVSPADALLEALGDAPRTLPVLNIIRKPADEADAIRLAKEIFGVTSEKPPGLDGGWFGVCGDAGAVVVCPEDSRLYFRRRGMDVPGEVRFNLKRTDFPDDDACEDIARAFLCDTGLRSECAECAVSAIWNNMSGLGVQTVVLVGPVHGLKAFWGG